MAEAVVVGVRVRPFNEREKNLNATLCIDMQGPATVITDNADNPSTFNFDQSFWSHDGFEDDGTGYMRPLPGSRYSDQRYVYDAFGQRVLDNAWSGYHCCLFAYGQTGAGKSYSMVGYGNNKGIVPISCEEIFKRISTNSDPNKSYEVMLSMMEIYNETVQDLFIAFDQRPKNGLQIRESKALGIYVDGVIKNAVDSYAAIEQAIEHGTANRSVGSTAMNATSSRAHTVITIEFKQVDKIDGREVVKASNVNLVDLAGSEKAGQTGAKGDRLKEGSAINKSLSALGNVIEKLAERSSSKNPKSVVIPYRDSKLTRLLQNALGGSSKTIMICALSPASSNYEETLSTLRYADRAKKIKNTVVVNENPQEKLMREMREENSKLKALLESGGGSGGGGADPELLKEQQEQIAQLEKMLQESSRSHQEKLEETKIREENYSKRGTKSGKNIDASQPLMVNLNAELQLSGKLRFEFHEDYTTGIGGHGESLAKRRSDDSDSESEEEPDILLGSDGVYAQHAKVQNVCRRCFLNCDSPKAARSTWVNGMSVDGLLSQPWRRNEDGWQLEQDANSREEEYQEGDPPGVLLQHGDRLVFGKGMFLFVDPRMGIPEMMIMTGQSTYSKARRELPENWRDMASGGKSLKNALQRAITAHGTLGKISALAKAKGNADAGPAGLARALTTKLASTGADGDADAKAASEIEHSDDDEDARLRSKVAAKDRELADLREKLQASQAAVAKAQEQEIKERTDKDRALLARAKAEEAARAALGERALAEAAARVVRSNARAAEQAKPATETKARLQEALARAQKALTVARSASVESSVVVGAEAKIEVLMKNVQVTDKLDRVMRSCVKGSTMELRIAIQQAKSVHGWPVDRNMIKKAEERLGCLSVGG